MEFPEMAEAQPGGPVDTLEGPRIRNVWSFNLEEEMRLLSDKVDDYPYVAFDTEFPGTLVRSLDRSEDGEYKAVKCNVDMLKLIQLGITLMDEEGRLAEVDGQPTSWQFNFREFSMENDLYALDSIDLLQQAGIDFGKNEAIGVDIQQFSELLMTSGLVLNEKVHWIGFATQYDVGYMLKALTCQQLPDAEADFFELVQLFFPNLYDIKGLPVVKFMAELQGGLNKLADSLDVKRIGLCHQAGSDSLLTAETFFKLIRKYYPNLEYVKQHSGKIAGLGDDAKGCVYTY